MVFRINKTEDYSLISNKFLKERRMSLKAKGLLAVMLALPEKWVYSIDGLVAICKEEESAVKSALKELKQFGYLTVDKKMPNETRSGRIEYIYNIYEQPQAKQGVENLSIESRSLHIDKYNIYNNNSNNKILNNKELNIPLKEEEATAKNEKERTINDVISAQSEPIQEPLKEFVKMRKAIKKPITTHGLELALKKLKELSNGDINEAIEIVNQSIMESWQGFFPLKDNKAKSEEERIKEQKRKDYERLIPRNSL